MGSPTYEALLKQLSWQKRYYDNHEPSADEVFDRVWFDKCMVLLDHITAVESQRDVAIAHNDSKDWWRMEQRAIVAEAHIAWIDRKAMEYGYSGLAFVIQNRGDRPLKELEKQK